MFEELQSNSVCQECGTCGRVSENNNSNSSLLREVTLPAMWGINLGRKRLAGHVGRADGGLRIMMRRRK